MRVSEYFELDRTQPSLDFVDVRVDADIRVFVDPRALRLDPSQWGSQCVWRVQSFFGTVLEHIRQDHYSAAHQLLCELREPNETRLGYSRSRPKGRALGRLSASHVRWSLVRSEAASSGLLQDLEDSILLVPHIRDDIVSDITTNLIRQPLIAYTQEMCRLYGIGPMESVASGPLWDPDSQAWSDTYVELPMTPHGPLLLVPKAIARHRMDYNLDEYYWYYLAPRLQAAENANLELVRLIRHETDLRAVTKQDVALKYGRTKPAIIRATRHFPEALEEYREEKGRYVHGPPSHLEMAEQLGTPPPDWDALLADVTSVDPGRQGGKGGEHLFQRAVEGLFTALFHPDLVNPRLESPLHGGRKRIDIRYTNMGFGGFFGWLAAHYPASNVFVETKNYRGDPNNPDLDQLCGRFGPSRGIVGLLVCRRISNKELFVTRCRDAAADGHGFVIPLDDDDLRLLVEERRKHPSLSFPLGLLKDRFDALI